jgi:hypothetical protein
MSKKCADGPGLVENTIIAGICEKFENRVHSCCKKF